MRRLTRGEECGTGGTSALQLQADEPQTCYWLSLPPGLLRVSTIQAGRRPRRAGFRIAVLDAGGSPAVELVERET